MILLRIAAFAALGGFLFGYDLGLIGGALLDITADLQINSVAQEVIVGAFKLGAFFGAFWGGALMLRYGRRKAIAFNSAFTTLGPIIMAASFGPGGLILGRIVGGFGIGACAIVIPAYLAEMAPAKHRGAVVQVYEMMLCIGMLTSMLIDFALQSVPYNWRWMVGMPAIPGAMMVLSLLVLPESPRWLVMRNCLDEALDVLHRVQGAGLTGKGASARAMAEAEDELLLLWSAVEKDKHAVLERRQQIAAQRQATWHSKQTDGALEGEPLLTPPSLAVMSTGSIFSTAHIDSSSNQRALLFDGPGASRPSKDSDDFGAPRFSLEGSEGALENAALLPLQPAVATEQLPPASRRNPNQMLGGDVAAADTLLLPRSVLIAGEWTSNAVEEGDLDEGDMQDDEQGRLLGPSSCQPSREQVSRAAPAHQPGAQHGSNQHQNSPGMEPTLWHTLSNMMLDIFFVARGEESKAFSIAMWLAFFNQATASTAIINFAPTVLRRMGAVNESHAMLMASTISLTKAVGVGIGLFLVDRWGRRPLLIWGAFLCSGAMVLATTAVAVRSAAWVLTSMCCFILAFSISWAGIYWIIVSEIFSMSAKSPASSAATALLFMSGSVTNLLFLSLVDWLDAYAFLVFAAVAFVSGIFVWRTVPETKGQTLTEIQETMKKKGALPSSQQKLPPAASSATSSSIQLSSWS